MAIGLQVTAGCGKVASPAATPQPFAVASYQDIVVDQALYGAFDPRTGVHTCADESRDSFVRGSPVHRAPC